MWYGLTKPLKKDYGEIEMPCAKSVSVSPRLINFLYVDLNIGKGESEVIALA